MDIYSWQYTGRGVNSFCWLYDRCPRSLPHNGSQSPVVALQLNCDAAWRMAEPRPDLIQTLRELFRLHNFQHSSITGEQVHTIHYRASKEGSRGFHIMEPWLKDHNRRTALRIYANQTTSPLWPLCLHYNFMSTYHGLTGTFSVIVKSSRISIWSSTIHTLAIILLIQCWMIRKHDAG